MISTVYLMMPFKNCSVIFVAGLVEEFNEGTALVNFMQKIKIGTGKFRWPTKPDRQKLPVNELLCLLPSSPEPSGWSSREFYVPDWKLIDTLLDKL